MAVSISHDSRHDYADELDNSPLDELDEEEDSWDTVRDDASHNPESDYDYTDGTDNSPLDELDEEEDSWDTVRDDVDPNPNLESFEEEMNDYDEIDD